MRTIETFFLPEKISDITKNEADLYFKTFLTTAPFLEQEVILPVKNALKRKTGYSDFKPPKENVTEQDFRIGETKFTVKTILSDKRPSYASLITSLYDYIYFAEEDARSGVKRDNLISKKDTGKTYLRADALVNIFTNMKDRITDTGIKQEIHYDDFPHIPDKISVPIVDYSRLPPEAGRLPEFEKFYNETIERTLKAFTNLLKKGVRNEGWKEIDNYLFHVCKIPSQSTEYAKIYDSLFLRRDEKSRKKCDEGELVLIANNKEGALKKSILDTYDITKRGKNFVSSKGLSKRLRQLTEEYTKEKAPTTKLFFYPFV
jgi:hypothetical protein